MSREHENRNGVIREWLNERGKHSGFGKGNRTFQLKTFPPSFRIYICRDAGFWTNYGSSSAVRVRDVSIPRTAHAGRAASAGNRQMVNFSGSNSNLSL